MRWYACYTRPRHEKQVDRFLEERGVECFLPLVQRTRQWSDRKKVVFVALFPSYVFVRVAQRQLAPLVSTPGVVAVVRNNGEPAVVPDEEIANVHRFAEALSRGEAEPELVPMPREGDRVCITEGPFQGISGIVLERRKRFRIVVGLDAIGWAVQAEVDAATLEVVRV